MPREGKHPRTGGRFGVTGTGRCKAAGGGCGIHTRPYGAPPSPRYRGRLAPGRVSRAGNMETSLGSAPPEAARWADRKRGGRAPERKGKLEAMAGGCSCTTPVWRGGRWVVPAVTEVRSARRVNGPEGPPRNAPSSGTGSTGGRRSSGYGGCGSGSSRRLRIPGPRGTPPGATARH
jgi:hypothetical protein